MEPSNDDEPVRLVPTGVPIVHFCWEVSFRPYQVTSELFNEIMEKISDVINAESPGWFVTRWGDVGLGGHFDKELTFTVDCAWELGRCPRVPAVNERGVVLGERPAVLADFQADCMRLVAKLGHEGWSTAQVIVSADRESVFVSDPGSGQEAPDGWKPDRKDLEDYS
jgi:hypothetical protein